jgi:NADP-dependent 3-hydroxy acid dehydrogenase YdfG
MPRVWLITGSSSGFGREIALAAPNLLQDGSHLRLYGIIAAIDIQLVEHNLAGSLFILEGAVEECS